MGPVTASVPPNRPATALLPHGGGVRATWWYTFLSAVFFAGTVLFVWFWVAAARGETPGRLVLYVAA